MQENGLDFAPRIGKAEKVFALMLIVVFMLAGWAVTETISTVFQTILSSI